MKKYYFLILAISFLLFSMCKEEDDPTDGTPCPNCPVITSISPAQGASGDTVLISGENFDRFGEEGNVTINGMEAIIVEYSPTTINVEITDEITSGEVIVCAKNPNRSKENILCSSQNPVFTAYGTTAKFEVSDLSGYAPLTVSFTNTSTSADSYLWNFGDPSSQINNTSTEENPVHEFDNPGLYNVLLVAQNSMSGVVDSFLVTINVLEIETFIKRYTGTKSSSFGRLFFETTDGYTIWGLSNNNGEPAENWKLRTETDGNLISGYPQTYTIGDHLTIAKTNEGGIATIEESDLNSIKLSIYDGDGFELINSPFDVNTFNYNIWDFIQTQDGGFAFVGQNENGTNKNTCLILTNSSGITNTNFPICFTNTGVYNPIKILQNENGGFAIVSWLWNGGFADVVFYLTDEYGNELPGSPNIFSTGEFVSDVSLDFCGTIDGGYIFTGYSGNGILFFKTDANGVETIAPKSINLSPGDSAEGLSILQLVDGRFAIVGRANLNSGSKKVVLVLLDENGDLLSGFPKTYNFGTNNTRGYRLIQTSDNGLLIMGTVSIGNNTDILLIKTDINGNVQ